MAIRAAPALNRARNPKPGRRRWPWRLVLAFVLAITVLAAAGIPIYVHPQVDTPRPADAIVVLGGHGDGRYLTGLRLASQGLAPQLVVSDPSDGRNDWLEAQCSAPHPFGVTCFAPHPATTRGEAREIRALAEAHGWQSVIVVTFTPHVSRARYIVQRCFTGRVAMVAAPAELSPAGWAWQYVYQTAGYIKAAAESGC